MLEALVFAVAIMAGAAMYGFIRPRGAFRRAALVLLCGLAGTAVIVGLLSAFANPAAGMGIFFIATALTLLIGAAALLMALGAAAGHGWKALR